MKHLLVALPLLFPGLLLAQTPLKPGGPTKLIAGPGSRVSRQEVTNGIVGWWKFNEGTGTSAADSSGNGNTGTLTGGTAWTNALYGGLLALAFDGVNDYVTYGDIAAADFGSGNFTLSLWVKRTAGSRSEMFIGKDVWVTGADNGIFIYTSGSASILYWNGSDGESFNAASGVWVHIAAAREGTGADQVKLYMNGVLQNSMTDARTLSNSKNFTVGADSTGANPYTGLGDDVRIYNRALTLAEIQLLFTNGPQ